MTFYQLLAEHYRRLFPLKPEKARFVISFMGIPSSILDIGCADGELCLTLSQLGHQTTGVDLDETMIARATEETRRRLTKGPAPRFHVLDMTQIASRFGAESFHAIFCLGNTLPHLKRLEDIAETVRSWRPLLRPEGWAIFQIVNYEPLRRGILPSFPVLETDRVLFRRSCRKDPDSANLLTFASELTDKLTGETGNAEVTLWPLTRDEFTKILRECGFQNIIYFGDFSGSPYIPDSPALIAAAKR